MPSSPKTALYLGLLTAQLSACGAVSKLGHKKAAPSPENVATPPPAAPAPEPAQTTKDKALDPAPSPSAASSAKPAAYFDFEILIDKHFKTACTPFKTTDPLDTSVAVIYDLQFNDVLGLVQTATTYTDATCTSPQIRYRSLVRISDINSSGGIETVLTNASATPLNGVIDQLWSKQQVDGYPNWLSGIEFPVYSHFYNREDISKVFGRKTVKVFQSYAIEGASFYWGQLDDTHDGSSGVQRPVAIDRSLEFVAQP